MTKGYRHCLKIVPIGDRLGCRGVPEVKSGDLNDLASVDGGGGGKRNNDFIIYPVSCQYHRKTVITGVISNLLYLHE